MNLLSLATYFYTAPPHHCDEERLHSSRMEAAGTAIGSSGGRLAVANIADRPLHNHVHVVELTRSSRRYIGHGNPKNLHSPS